MSDQNEQVSTVPNARNRICELVARHLDSGKLGLEVESWDVVWGTFTVPHPQTGQPINVTGYGLIIAAKGRLQGGPVLLGVSLPLQTNVHVLNGMTPTEQEIKDGIIASYESIRGAIAEQARQYNGHGQLPPRR
jgi:hypothetical protein